MSKTFQEYYELMTRALKFQGKQEKTSEGYLRTLRRVHERVQKPLDEFSPEDLKSYFFEILKTHSWSTVNIDRSSLVFFYTQVLERKWDWIKIVKAPKNKSIPDILTRE